MKKTKKQIIHDTICDLVSDFLYYDRKEDDLLKLYVIEKVIDSGEISIKWIVDIFEKRLTELYEKED